MKIPLQILHTVYTCNNSYCFVTAASNEVTDNDFPSLFTCADVELAVPVIPVPDTTEADFLPRPLRPLPRPCPVP